METTTQTTTQTSAMPKLTVDYEITQDGLSVEYRLKNDTREPIYIFNVLLAPGSLDTVADAPFFSSLKSDGTLTFSKRIPPVPLIRSVEFRQIPFATKVEPGGSFSDKQTLKLPVEEFNPYFPKGPDAKVEVAESDRVVFVLQFVREIEGLDVKEAPVSNAYKLYHKDLLKLVETINSDPRPLRVKVERRTDTFERF